VTTAATSPELDRALRDLRQELQSVEGGTRNPVGAARALQRVASRHPLPLATSRDAFRWGAEKALRPFFASLAPEQAAQAVTWLALDAAWQGGRRAGR
jgi:alkanesulfonate monooxygenase SsuD/methylene tetrahydromethanopterin reductase-like flavin-dependent oxidoreductase (luciferase family)